jgi:diguanylate cyclase (GGDEF)-like protein
MARIGGDEFAVLLVGRNRAHAPPAGAQTAMARLREAVDRQAASAHRPYALSMSMGHSHFDPEAPRPLESLLQEADQQMYAKKRERVSLPA